ncbi:hypothetical protein V4762_09855 [Thermodesulfobium sp. 4217-1]|uniref:hypothetical protein n=1 Tax=Thermodesulfobium sp. 4217-1 TaxID=3120013 RepID=UPI00322149C0
MNQMLSFFKKPKVLPILVFFLILAVSQARWDYVGSNFYHDEFVRYKIDRFTDFKYVEIFSDTGSGDRPAYSEMIQYPLYKMAENAGNIEEVAIRGLFALDFVWLCFVWILLPFIYFIKNKIFKKDSEQDTISPV